MTQTPGKYADFEGLRERAIALRRAKRPHAKDDLRDRARELRLQGRTYDQIQVELGRSKSSISLWVRDLPKPERRKRTREEASATAKRGWEARLRLRDEERRRTKQTAAAEVDRLTDRELFLIGVGLYWAEGSKSKPYSRRERVTFVNSDPDMITVFLAWLKLLRTDPGTLRFAVQIHETANVTGAEKFWADHVGIETTELLKTTLKKHNPSTNRKNTAESYYGCLRVDVRDGAELYRRIEGWWYGIVGAVTAADLPNRT
ncbi:hypothetical protein ACGFYV_09000 [Streptomyces sp. NPDC048297]|uniref:hypothetical protein n=1 Tax=Streptomyces sp. NPDC048297 TaxID=3365531 RepID=UPI003712F7C3